MLHKTLVEEERERAEISAVQDQVRSHPAIRAWEAAGPHEMAHRFGKFMFEIMNGAKGGINADTVSTPLTKEEEKAVKDGNRYGVYHSRPCVGRWLGTLGYGGRAQFEDAQHTFSILDDVHVTLVQKDAKRAVVASFLKFKRDYIAALRGNVDPNLHLAHAKVSIPTRVRKYLDVAPQQDGDTFKSGGYQILLDMGEMPITDILMVGLSQDDGPSQFGNRYGGSYLQRNQIGEVDGASLGIVVLSEGRRLQTLALTAKGPVMYGLLDKDGDPIFEDGHEDGVMTLLRTVSLPAGSKHRRVKVQKPNSYSSDECNAVPTHEVVDPAVVDGKHIGYSGTVIDAWQAVLDVPEVSAFLADWTGRERRMNAEWDALKESHAALVLRNCNF